MRINRRNLVVSILVQFAVFIPAAWALTTTGHSPFWIVLGSVPVGLLTGILWPISRDVE